MANNDNVFTLLVSGSVQYAAKSYDRGVEVLQIRPENLLFSSDWPVNVGHPSCPSFDRTAAYLKWI